MHALLTESFFASASVCPWPRGSTALQTAVSAVSEQGFEDAIRTGITRATQTLRNVEGAWVKDMNVLIDNGTITGYKVNLAVTFVMEDGAS